MWVGADRTSFVSALRWYIHACKIAYPNCQRGAFRSAGASKSLKHFVRQKTRLAAKYQAEFLRATLSGEATNATRPA
jgi:hypothetical protein